jgi:Arc/MetJ-type ribon-helix-helix transcriptional regulator
MEITISSQTQRLLDQEMKRGGYASADDVVRAALQTLNDVKALDYDDLDEGTRAAIERAEVQNERGEGIPVDDAFARLRRKHLGS